LFLSSAAGCPCPFSGSICLQWRGDRRARRTLAVLLSLLLEGSLQDRRPLFLCVSLLRFTPVGGLVLLLPSVPAAFVRHPAEAVLVQHLRMPLSPLPAFVCPAVGAVLSNPSTSMEFSPLPSTPGRSPPPPLSLP
jgi:hypothetical protein